jgi:NAD+ diphosphatase
MIEKQSKLEASAKVAFSGGALVRLSEKRTDDAIETARADKNSCWMLIAHGKVVLDFSDEAKPRALFGADELRLFEPEFANGILLGFDKGVAHCAVRSVYPIEDMPPPFRAVDYRAAFSQGLLGQADLAILAQGAALMAWHSNHRYCGKCGAETAPKAGGAKRICEGCLSEHFPRTDPVAIMLTVRGDQCLLARGAHFPEGMVSCLAGFIEAGETIEEAVRRETLEEAGIRTGAVTYHASQPWPFPYSLMIGCFAQALNDEIVLEETELEMGRWFSKAEVRQMLAGEHPEGWRVPPSGAIASVLIADWAAG